MMSYMKIERTEDTPEVVLDAKNGTILISGISFPEDIEFFFSPVLCWVEEYVQNAQQYTEIIFKMDYFNTASSKKFLEILLELEKIIDTGKDLKVKWLFPDEDEDIKSAGVKFSSLTKSTFELEKY